MTTPFPHRYEVTLSLEPDGGGVLGPGPRGAILGGPPPQFDGRDDWWSPEQLLLAAAALCLMTTFQAMCRRAAIEVLRYSGGALGTLEKTREGIQFTAVHLDVELEVSAEQVTRAEALLASAKEHCIVANALKPPVTLSRRITASSASRPDERGLGESR